MLVGKSKWDSVSVGSLSLAVLFTFLAIFLTIFMEKEELHIFIHKIIYKEEVTYEFSVFGKARIFLFYVNHILFFFETVFFPFLIINELFFYKRNVKNYTLSNIKKPPLLRCSYSVSSIIIITSLITLFLSVKLLLTGKPSTILISLTSLIYCFLLFWIGVFSLRETRFIGKTQSTNPTSKLTDNNTRTRENNYFSSGDKIEDNKLKDRLIQLFEEDEVFKNQNLKINDVASLLNTNRTYISNVINNNIGCSFSDFVNFYRVENVKEMLKDPIFNDLTLMEISEKAGFSGSNSFYRIFKKFENKAPNQYRQEKIFEKYMSN